MLSLIAGAFGIFGGITENASGSTIPEYQDGYGYDNETGIMQDTNGFQYSYQADGIVKMVLPWGYTTHFSFGLTGDYLGVPQVKTALDYSWNWDILVGECLNETGNLTGYSYIFTATNDAGNLDWTIAFEFDPNARMKVTHTIENGYANTLENVEFWYLFDLLGTASPYTIETELGTVEGPLYQEISDSVYWVRLANQFQFNWRDALVDYENANAYIGDGSVIGMDGVPILGISLDIGSIGPGDAISIDPYFSGVERTWTAAADGVASNPSRWTPNGIPQTGDNITFDGTSVFNCNWDVEVTLGNFSILTGYTGTVTQTVDFGVASYYHIAGVFTGSQSYTLTDYGDYYHAGGTVTYGVLKLIMAGDGSTYSTDSNDDPWSFQVSANITVTNPTDTLVRLTYYTGLTSFIIDTDKIMTVAPGKIAVVFGTSFANIFTNKGIITGDYTSTFRFTDNSAIPTYISPGVINCPFAVQVEVGAARTVELTGPAILGSTLSIISTHGIATCTLDLSNSNYPLSATNITLSNNAFLNARASTIICSGNWDSSLGTFIEGTSSVYMTGTDKTIKTESSNSFYNLESSGTLTTESSVNVSHNLNISDTLTVGASKVLNWVTNGTFTNTGTITGTGIFEIDLSMDYNLSFGEVTIPTTIGIPVWTSTNRILTLVPDTTLQANFTIEAEVILETEDIIVTFSDDMELDFSLSPTSSLWNCTVESGVTLTLTVDVIVNRRATIIGTVIGDFLEPLPEFTSRPVINAYRGEIYEYVITQTYWDDLEIIDGPYWLYSTDHTLEGVPYANQTGIFYVSIALTWNDMITYQNFTLYVSEETPWMPFDFFMYFSAMLILLAINIIGACVPQVRILTLFGIFGIAVLCVPTALVMIDYGPIALILILVNVMVPVMSTVNNIKDK